MSDQDTPPPMDDNSSDQDTPPPVDSAPAEESPSIADSIPMDAPPVGGVGLGQGTLPESDEKTMGLLGHLLGGVTCFVGPLIIWLIKKDESPFIDDQGKEALNFQITIGIAYLVTGILSAIPFIGCLGVLAYGAAFIVSVIFAILGGVEANKGVPYRYPFALRLIS